VVSDTRTFYDDNTFDTTFPQKNAPAKGDVTMTRQAADYTGGAFTWQTSSRAKFDSVGRPTDAYDGNGNDTVTAYTTDSAGLVTGQRVTNPLQQPTSKTLDTQRGLELTSTDLNGVVSTQQYDTLGRVTGIWLYGRVATSAPANYKFTYAVGGNGPTAVTTQALNDALGYRTQTLIYDGLFRERQIQTDTPRGGRVITDTFYDSRGWTAAKYTNWLDTDSTPSTTIASAADLEKDVPQEDVYTYNSLGDQVIDQNENNGVEVSRTTTVDNGDRKTVFPPAGGTVTTTITDPLGRTSEVDDYVGRPVLNSPADPFTGIFTVTGGSSRPITYGFDGHGNPNSTTQGAGGPTWTNTYNLLGQQVTTSDPDAGTSTGLTYDGAGNLLRSTDARGRTTSFTYDVLNRKIGKFDGTGNQLGAWVYDNADTVAGVTHAIGQLTTETSYLNGAAYTTQQTDFNVFGKSLGTTVTIPSAEKSLAGDYTVKHVYSGNSGLLLKDTYQGLGGLPAETVVHSYRTADDLPDGLSGTSPYAQTTSYDAVSRVNEIKIGPSTSTYTTIDNSYDPNDGKLTDRLVDHTANGVTSALDDQKYAYDLSGNITGQTSTRNGSADSSETQCYSYDGLDELVSAWTANDRCAATPATTDSSTVADKLGAGAAYWTTWSFDNLGDRSSQTQHGFAGGPAGDTTTNYSYGSAGAQPHTLTSTSTTGATTASTSYSYDAAGNMIKRNAGQGNQTLGYDDDGNLTAVTGSATGDTAYEYDADGTLLVQKEPATTTLYVDDQQFTMTNATGAVAGTRYYTLPDGSQVVRTGTASSFGFAINDQHDTPSLYLDNNAASPTWREYTPYGGPRGADVTAPDNRGFLDKPMDATTGLTIVGARQYDPDTGRFITADPVFERDDPTAINGYAYAGNNPVNDSDPSGQWSFGSILKNVVKAVKHVAKSIWSTISPNCKTHGCSAAGWGGISGGTGYPLVPLFRNLRRLFRNAARYAVAVRKSVLAASAKRARQAANKAEKYKMSKGSIDEATSWGRYSKFGGWGLAAAGGAAAGWQNYEQNHNKWEAGTVAAADTGINYASGVAGAAVATSIVGALAAGAEEGALLGTLAGPAGTIVGAAAGALIGGAVAWVATGYANKAIHKIFHW
jgi:RHS repeat-associated protein